jgi:hypothetical protein
MTRNWNITYILYELNFLFCQPNPLKGFDSNWLVKRAILIIDCLRCYPMFISLKCPTHFGEPLVDPPEHWDVLSFWLSRIPKRLCNAYIQQFDGIALLRVCIVIFASQMYTMRIMEILVDGTVHRHTYVSSSFHHSLYCLFIKTNFTDTEQAINN